MSMRECCSESDTQSVPLLYEDVHDPVERISVEDVQQTWKRYKGEEHGIPIYNSIYTLAEDKFVTCGCI